MLTRHLGAYGLEVSAIGIGAVPFAAYYGDETTEADAIKIMRLAFDKGVTLIDTADVYGDGSNEILVGKAVAGRRDDVIISTKFGYLLNQGEEWGAAHGRPEYVKSACEASLERLNVDAIDLYIQHRVDPTTPIEETVGAMQELVDEGKVRFLGLSEAQPEDIRRASAVAEISILQTEYSMFERFIERAIRPLCETLKVGIIAYAPLGRGLLAGSFTSSDTTGASDRRRTLYPRLLGENLRSNLDLVARLRELANAHKISTAQLALAWLLAQSDSIVPIPGTDRVEYLHDNIGATEIELTLDELGVIDDLIPPGGSAAGERIIDVGDPVEVTPPPDVKM